MRKKWMRLAAISCALALTCGTLCGAAQKKTTFGATLALDPDRYSEEAFRQELAAPKEGALELAADGRSVYQIVYAEQAGERMREAARFFQSALETMTGARLPLVPDSQPVTQHEIVLGETNRFPAAGQQTLGADGYLTKTQGQSLWITGTSERGSIYGIYGFLEDTLGCMWIAQDADYIPYCPTIRLAPMDEVKTPAMAWRNVYAFETTQNGWFEKLRLNGLDWEDENTAADHPYGTPVNQYAGWGTWCHSYLSYVPVEQYYNDHPEYFAMKDGARIARDEKNNMETQLCLTNPEVLQIVKDEMRSRMEAEPDQLYWDFSVMDSWSVKGCECDNCKALDKAAGSGMGSLLPFINELAREFPDKYISTLAYFHTTDAPRGLTAEPNVVIKLCSMPGDQASSYAQGGTSGAANFQKQIKAWNAVCSHLIIWDYVVDFSHLLLPFPNFAIQQENQKFYEDSNVMGIFHQASRESSDEFADLRTYVLARLMWDGSALDVNALIDKYLVACYGDAAPYLSAYLQSCADRLHASQSDLGLYDAPEKHKNGYLSKEAIAEYQRLFEQAKQAVAQDSVLLTRVEEAELPVLYAKMMEPSLDKKGKKAAAEQFFPRAKACGVTRLSETSNLLDEFEGAYPAMITKMQLRIVGIPLGILAGVCIIAGAGFGVFRFVKKRKDKKPAAKSGQ